MQLRLASCEDLGETPFGVVELDQNHLIISNYNTSAFSHIEIAELIRSKQQKICGLFALCLTTHCVARRSVAKASFSPQIYLLPASYNDPKSPSEGSQSWMKWAAEKGILRHVTPELFLDKALDWRDFHAVNLRLWSVARQEVARPHRPHSFIVSHAERCHVATGRGAAVRLGRCTRELRAVRNLACQRARCR